MLAICIGILFDFATSLFKFACDARNATGTTTWPVGALLFSFNLPAFDESADVLRFDNLLIHMAKLLPPHYLRPLMSKISSLTFPIINCSLEIQIAVGISCLCTVLVEVLAHHLFDELIELDQICILLMQLVNLLEQSKIR